MERTLKNIKNTSAIIIILMIGFASSCGWGTNSEETVNPQIVDRSPGEDATDVPVNAQVTVTFSEPVSGIDNTETAFTLQRVGAVTPIVANVHYDSGTKTATLDPEENLEFDSYYVVTLTEEIRDRAGNILAGAPVTWIFITGNAVDSIDPEIISRSPYIGEQDVSVGTDIVVEFSEPVVNVNNAAFRLVLAADVTETPIAGSITYSNLAYTFDPSVNLAENTQYKIIITDGSSGIKDIAGNQLAAGDSYSWIFKTEDATPPVISSRYPAANETGVGINADITIAFSEPIIHASSDTIELFTLPGLAKVTSISLSYNADTYEVTLKLVENQTLDTNIDYRVAVSSGITDYSGNPFAATQWEFHTALAADETPPSISTRTPDVGAVNIAVNSNVTVVFSESVTGVNDTSFKLIRVSDSFEIPSSVNHPAPDTGTLDPISNLDEGTEYSVVLTSAIKDGPGNTLAPANWTFTTADETDPTAITRTPLPGAALIARNTRVTVVFSEDVVGVDELTFTLEDSGSTPVAAVVVYYSSTRTAILAPSAFLNNVETYTVYLKAGITDISANNNALIPVNWTFTTRNDNDTTPPGISSSFPGVGAPGIAQNANITVEFDEPVNGVSNLTFKLKETVSGTYVANFVGYDIVSRTATLDPDDELKGSTGYTVELIGEPGKIEDAAGNDFPDTTWTFTTAADNNAPTIAVRNPDNGQGNVASDTAVIVTFSENVTGVSGTTFTLKQGATPVAATVTYDSATRTAMLTPSDLLRQETGITYTLTLDGTPNLIEDIAGNDLADATWTFTTLPDTTPPTVYVNSETPIPGSTGVAVNTNISATFSEDINQTTFDLTTFYLTPAIAGAVFTFDSGSKTATLNPNSDLTGLTLYTVTIKSGISGVKDLGNNSLTTDVTWSFTTGATPDTTPPTYSTRVPDSGATGVATNLSAVTVTFSENVENMSTSSFTLKQGTTSIPAAVNYDNNGGAGPFTATLDPTYNLLISTVYTVRLTSAIVDGAGNVLSGAPVTWTFTTGATDNVAPVYISRTPDQGATGVQLKPEITVVFSEAVTGISRTTFTLSGGVIFDVYYDSTTFTATLIPRTNLANNTLYTAALDGGTGFIEDLAGNDLVDTSWTFTTATAPVISSATPADGASGTSVNLANLVINFDSEMDTDYGSISFSGGFGYLINPVWTNCNAGYPTTGGCTTLTYDVDGPLSAGTTYTAAFSSWWEPFSDTDGNELNVTNIGGTLTFGTGADGAGPTISSTIPDDGATGVGMDIPVILIRFSERMMEQGDLSGIFEGAAVWLENDTAVKFPVSGLSGSTLYNITLNSFQDRAGNSLSGNTFSFTTGSNPGSTVITNSGETFETYTAPVFSNYMNISGDDKGWIASTVSKTPYVTAPQGAYMGLADALAWLHGENAVIEQVNSSSFSTAGTYLLSFTMGHETLNYASDMLQVYISTGGAYTLVSPPLYRFYNSQPSGTSGDSLSDGFETDFSKWDGTTTTTWTRSTSQAHGGSYSADGTYNASPQDLISDDIDTSTADSFTVSLWYYDNVGVTTPLTDGFEAAGAAWDDNWDGNNTTSWTQSATQKYGGTYAALGTYNASPQDLISDDIDTSTADSFTVSLWYYNNAAAPTTVLTDSFDGATWNTNWNLYSTTPNGWARNSTQKYTGTYSAYATNNSEGDFISNNIDTSNATSVTVSFYYREVQLEDADIDVYFYNGTGYGTAIEEFGADNTEGNWWPKSYTVTDPQYFKTNFRVRFNANVGAGEEIWIDDVLVTVATGVNTNDDVWLQYYDGAAYDNIIELGAQAGAGSWQQYTQTLNATTPADSQYFKSNFRLRVAGTGIDTGEYMYIDDVAVNATYEIGDSDDVYLQYYNGTTYNNIIELGNQASPGAWHQYTSGTITDAQYLRPDFRLRFAGSLIDANEHMYIDDVTVNVTSDPEWQWQTHYVDLSSYSGQANVKVRFEAVSGGETGGNILLDDVQLKRY